MPLVRLTVLSPLALLLLGAIALPRSVASGGVRVASPDPETLSEIFDGTGGAPSLRLLLDEVPAVPAPAARPVEAPADLREARGVWGNEAQLSKLRRGHPDPKEAFTIAIIGDSEPGHFWDRWWGPGRRAYRRHLGSIHGQGPDLIVHLGDFVTAGKVKTYRAYLKTLQEHVTLPIVHLIGNHDRTGGGQGPGDKTLFRAVFGDLTDFHFDYNGCRFVVLDSADYRVTGAQLDWLDRSLDTPLRKLVFTHMGPSYLKGKLRSIGPDGAGQDTGGMGFMPKGFFDAGSERFGEIVARRSVERVYFGHIHASGVAELSGVRYVLTGGGGSPLYPLPPGYPRRRKAHYILLRVDPRGLHETVHELSGVAFPVP